jgi:hypothetical protein
MTEKKKSRALCVEIILVRFWFYTLQRWQSELQIFYGGTKSATFIFALVTILLSAGGIKTSCKIVKQKSPLVPHVLRSHHC